MSGMTIPKTRMSHGDNKLVLPVVNVTLLRRHGYVVDSDMYRHVTG